MRGAIPPLLQYVFMAWCLVKHRDNFTFKIKALGQSVQILDLQTCWIPFVTSDTGCLKGGQVSKFSSSLHAKYKTAHALKAEDQFRCGQSTYNNNFISTIIVWEELQMQWR
jgi:hypothetical protein